MTTRASSENRRRLSVAKGLLALAVLVVALVPAGALAEGGNGKAKVFAPNAHPYGKSYAEWTATWWPWALAEPAATNPVVDPTGASCAVGQPGGKVWLLAGTFGGAATRECTVPKGKALLLPLVNNFWCAFPEDPPNEKTLEFIRAQMAFVKRDAANLSATIDGVAVPNLRDFYVESAVFRVVLPPGNVAGAPAGLVCDPSVDFGFYLIVKPLSTGEHTIRFTGGFADTTGALRFSTDTTYHLTVARTHGSDDEGDD
jgi:hypothetical protein